MSQHNANMSRQCHRRSRQCDKRVGQLDRCSWQLDRLFVTHGFAVSTFVWWTSPKCSTIHHAAASCGRQKCVRLPLRRPVQDLMSQLKNKEKATPSLCQKRKTQLSSRTKEKKNLRRKETPLSQGKEQSQLSHEKQTHPREKPDHLKRKK